MNPSAFAFVVLVAGLWASGTRMVTVFVVLSVFGASAAVELTALGGAPLNPAVCSLPFLLWWAVRTCGISGLIQETRYPSPGIWLLCLTIWGVFSAYALPRYFEGDTFVFGTSRTSGSFGPSLIALAPSSTNFTQTCYLIGGLLAFVAMRSLLHKDRGLHRFRDSVIILAIVNVLAGALGLVEEHLRIPLGMDVIRNANYAINGSSEVAGLVRIVGTFSEASTFAAFTAPLMACMASLWRGNQRPKLTGPIALVSFLLLAFSTSSSAYGTLIVYGLLLVGRWAFTATVSKDALRIGAPFVIVWLVLAGTCLLVLMKPELFEKIYAFFEVTVWTKLDSSSGVERGSWNTQAWTAFLETYGVGAGLGSARASNIVLVLLSNLGFIGGIVFVAFVFQVFPKKPTSSTDDRYIVSRAAGHAVLVTLISGMFGATVFDLGTAFYCYAAAASAVREEATNND